MIERTKTITEETGKRIIELLAHAPTATAAKSVQLAKKPVLQFRNSQILMGITGTTGLIIFALGIENFISGIPNLSSPVIEIIIGLILLTFSGLLLKKLV